MPIPTSDIMVDISTKFAGLFLKNPTMLAAGIFGETGDSLLKIAQGGAGALVTKSIGIEPREGHPNPTFVETQGGILNAMGLPNPGIMEYKDEMRKALTAHIPVIGSIFGANTREFSQLAIKMQEYGTSAIELNLSCPHAKGYGAEVGNDKDMVLEITKAVKDVVMIPVFVKLSPNVSNISELASAVKMGGGDGIVAINTIKAMAINPQLKVPILSNSIGGLSGPAVKPIGIRCVYEIAATCDVPVIGVGGILTGVDAVEYIMAGASAIQIGSGVFYEGEGIFRKISSEIYKFMESNGYETLKEMIGIAQKR